MLQMIIFVGFIVLEIGVEKEAIQKDPKQSAKAPNLFIYVNLCL